MCYWADIEFQFPASGPSLPATSGDWKHGAMAENELRSGGVFRARVPTKTDSRHPRAMNNPLPRKPTAADLRVLSRMLRKRLLPPRRMRQTKQYAYDVAGVKLAVFDFAESMASEIDYFELRNDEYGLEAIGFEPGDTVVDIGGNIGFVAGYIASRHPGVRVLSFEPFPDNHEHFGRLVETNGVKNVTLHPLGVTADGRELTMTMNPHNSGGATANVANPELPGHSIRTVSSTTLDDIFARYDVKSCKLLKIDCEGSEHEILKSTSVLDRVSNISGEFHINQRLESEGHSMEELVRLCESFVGPDHVRVKLCRMAE